MTALERWRGAAFECAQGSRIFFPGRERPNIGLNSGSRELPTAMFRPALGSNSSFHAPRDKPRVEPFAGAAGLTEFVAIQAPRKIARVSLGAINSGSPPVRFCSDAGYCLLLTAYCLLIALANFSAENTGGEQVRSVQIKAAALSRTGYSTSLFGNAPSWLSHHSTRL